LVPAIRNACARRSVAPRELHTMQFEIKACTITEVRPHPLFVDRMHATAKVMLLETWSRESFYHNLTIKVWANTNERMTRAEVNSALLIKVAAILKRTITAVELVIGVDGKVTKPMTSG
jgi:hypothetical protein